MKKKIIMSLFILCLIVSLSINICYISKSKGNKVNKVEEPKITEDISVCTMNYDIVEIPMIFPDFKFRTIKNESGNIAAMEGVHGRISILAVGGKGVEELNITFLDIKSRETKKFLDKLVSVCLRDVCDNSNLILNLFRKDSTGINIGDCRITASDNGDDSWNLELKKVHKSK